MQQICSKDNPKFKAVRALLRSKKQREQSARFVMEGVRALSALADGTALPHYRLRELWISDKADEASLPCLQEKEVSLFRISHAAMEQLSDCCTSQGLLGVVEHTPVPLQIDPEQGSYLLLDGLTDPGNMGTIIRSAAGLGVDGLLLYGDCVDIYNPKCLRSTAGLLPFVRITQIAETDLDCIIAAGAQLLVAEGGHGDSLHDWSPSADCIIAIGNEAHGVCESIRRRATGSLRIPLEAVCESLNAAVAAAIIMYQISKSRRKNFQSLDNLC